jgi:hypothetical protein
VGSVCRVDAAVRTRCFRIRVEQGADPRSDRDCPRSHVDREGAKDGDGANGPNLNRCGGEDRHGARSEDRHCSRRRENSDQSRPAHCDRPGNPVAVHPVSDADEDRDLDRHVDADFNPDRDVHANRHCVTDGNGNRDFHAVADSH